MIDEKNDPVLEINKMKAIADLVSSFALRLEDFLIENLKDTPVGLVILKDADFKQIGGIEEIRGTHFIPVYNGLFYVGCYDPMIGGYLALSS